MHLFETVYDRKRAFGPGNFGLRLDTGMAFNAGYRRNRGFDKDFPGAPPGTDD